MDAGVQNPRPKGKLARASCRSFMTQSPPKASASSRPPRRLSHVDGGRRITALAAGGSVLLLSATAVALWPRTYGTSATFVLDGARADRQPHRAGGSHRSGAARARSAGQRRHGSAAGAALTGSDWAAARRHSRAVARRARLYGRVSRQRSAERAAHRQSLGGPRRRSLVPKLATSPVDNAPALALAERSRAVTEFLTAHPEITLEATRRQAQPLRAIAASSAAQRKAPNRAAARDRRHRQSLRRSSAES